jgi:hypothetical protein
MEIECIKLKGDCVKDIDKLAISALGKRLLCDILGLPMTSTNF